MRPESLLEYGALELTAMSITPGTEPSGRWRYDVSGFSEPRAVKSTG